MTAGLDPDLVAGLTGAVLPRGLSIVARDPRRMPMVTEPQEVAAVKNAVPRRLAEFHAGRAAARAAMVALGLPPRPIPMGPDRAPLWPEGLTGSISHSADACVAVVGLRNDWAGIGVDLEEATALAPDLFSAICTEAEQKWLATQPASERGLMAKLIFSAKEAAYKAQFSITGELFGFQTLELSIDREKTTFNAVFQMAKGPIAVGSILAGSYAHAAGLLVTGVAVRHSDLEQLISPKAN